MNVRLTNTVQWRSSGCGLRLPLRLDWSCVVIRRSVRIGLNVWILPFIFILFFKKIMYTDQPIGLQRLAVSTTGARCSPHDP